LVAEHLNSAEAVAAGLGALPGVRKAFASTPAAWRFDGNERMTLEQVAVPLIDAGREARADSAGHSALMAPDWSPLDYSAHGSKAARARLRGQNLWGDELHSALVLSEQTGAPVAVLWQSSEAADGRHSTCSKEVWPAVSQLDGLSEAIEFVDGCELGQATVHIADRGCDAVWHYRHWQQEQRFLVGRAKTHRIIKHEGREKSLRAVVKELREQQLFRYRRGVGVKGRGATQYLAETTVVITRPAKPQRTRHGPRPRRVPGAAIALRVVVRSIADLAGELLSEGWLWTNVQGPGLPGGVPDAQIAQWYDWRWRIVVSREGPITQSVQVRPRRTDSGLVAREAPGRESQPVKPSDNPLGRERAQRSRL
jgi:hypothetical protein